jgi:transcriptional regulator with XRE-family HTH domain
MDTNPYSQSVADAVKAAMTEAGYTELGLSEASGIPRVTLRRRLQGTYPFNVVELAAIAAALGISIEDLTTPKGVAS